MKSDKERVLEYLADLMPDDQKTAFENECRSSEELNMLLEKYGGNLSILKKMSNADVDERYFNNLVPNIRTRLAKNKKHSLVLRLSSFAPALALTIFIAFNIFYLDIKTSYSFKTLLADAIADSDSGTIADLYTEYSTPIIDEYSIDYEMLEQYWKNLDLSEIELTNQFNYQLTDNYYSYDDLSEEEIENIYNTLLNKKIL